ncbi:hypothetical protein [Pseudomonas sp. KB-10]|uniref:hypothetical protein n=1 Tax=Pseudomonas sp. KB-10 TaxID=2292264 RepID=UPI001BAF8C18|nr:hypothetical protein [Pseudomonas sp. KB-10]
MKDKNQIHLEGGQCGEPTTAAHRAAFALLDHFSMMALTGAVDALVTAKLMSATPL